MNIITNQDVDDLKAQFQDTNWAGKCFDISFLVYLFFAKREIQVILVYANITINEKIMSNAWIEYDELFIDLTQPHKHWVEYKKHYYAQATIHRIEKYTFDDIRYLQKKYNKLYAWGDWLIYNLE